MNSNIHIPWPEWEITKEIGRGGFGTVYEIQKDIFGKREYAALKVLSIPESAQEVDELYSRGYDKESISAHFKGHLEEIIREYSIMVDLKGHANIIYCDEVKYIQHEDGIGWDIFIKMELLKPLNMISSSEYNEDEVIRLGKDLCNALIFCSQQNIIHRDIKPQNIFVSKHGSYKLGDFGVAMISDKTINITKIGAYEYMAPEVYRAQHYGSRVDIYSLGLVMYWMMNQKCTPFLPLPPKIPTFIEKENARNRRLDGEQLPPPVNGSDKLKAIVLKACAFDPQNRYASAQDMLNALQNMNTTNSEPIPGFVDLDVHKEMTFEHTNHPAGKYLSIQIESNEVHFSVPMDIKDGQTIHLRGKGKYDCYTGRSGDLYITVHIKKAPPQTTIFTNKFIYIAIAAVAVVLAIFFIMPKNVTSTDTPPVNNTPQTPPVVVQEYKPKETIPPETQHEHNWIEATYDNPKTCTTCGATEGKPLNPFADASVGDTIIFGNYGNSQILWSVLEKRDDKILVISDYGLDCKPYDDQDSENWDPSAVSWNECSLRAWLNESFYNAAFSQDEKKLILRVSDDGINDRVFILSLDQLITYFPSRSNRMCLATPYSEDHGSSKGGGWWWLRTNEKASHVFSVNTDGTIDNYTRVNGQKATVRVCIWIDIT